MTLSKIVIGIDPGIDGGIAIMQGYAIWSVFAMPRAGKEVDGYAAASIIYMYLKDECPTVACIEKVGAMPGQGVTSMFNFGESTGIVEGIMMGLNIPLFKVTPQAWKKEILAGTKQDKDAAIAYVRRAYPDVNLLETERCKKYHDGMADAVCIARYATRMKL